MKKKYGWTAKGIVGFIFAPTGLLFTGLGLGLGTSPKIRWKGPDGPVIFTAVFCGIGGIFLLTGLVLLGLELRRRYRLRRAYESGNCVDAEILGVTEQGSVNMNGQHPRMLEAAWTDGSGVVHIYRSRYLYSNVDKLLTSKTVPVYIDRYDDSVGFVDIDAVLPEIRIHG